MIQEKAQVMYDDIKGVTPHITSHREHFRHKPTSFSDWLAKSIVHTLSLTATLLFKKRYGHRAVVLETIAAVPGMVGGAFQHLKALRFIRDDRGWIKTLLDEEENERMHLMIYNELTNPTGFERVLILIVQIFFYSMFSFLYFFSPNTAHRVVGYLEEEAVHSYETYLRLVHEGAHENVQATTFAKSYWKLQDDARLTDMIEATIKDEMLHRDVNHRVADDPHASLWTR